MPDERRRERDLILAPNEYAYLLDETKGNIINYVGPHKTSLANTDQPVTFNPKSKRFERCHLDEAINPFAIAPEGWYIVLKNPSQDGKMSREGTANSLPDLDVGRKINIAGPISFAPWPGQMVKILQGHRLRSNQYLIVRVYDEEAAREHWEQAVIKPQTATTDDEPETTASPDESVTNLSAEDLTMGKQIVIKGTEVSFYIPPTGMEVVSDNNGRYVRNAVTLERLEYCILLDENGNKRYIKGPAVVFPHPTETFIGRDGQRKFRAIELNEISGLYIKVIAPYEEEGVSYSVGQELFLTGQDQMIYFPRAEHALVRYEGREINYAVAIPEGEARYVLNRLTGHIRLERGPSMFLADPRKEVIVRRVLSAKEVRLWFPNNQEAESINEALRSKARKKKLGRSAPLQAQIAMAAPEAEEVLDEYMGDEFNRRQQFTPPRTVTLETKYDGAVTISVWTGYAVQVISKSGERQVIVGPQTYLLEYDETLGVVELSTGTPKTDEYKLQTVYLRVLHNKVSDVITAETRDACQVQMHLSYRVNFDGEASTWFNVEDYVKFLTDHMRSLLNHAIRQMGIEEFYANAIDVIRNTVLGSATEGERPGRTFSENGMHIYDVEVLAVTIQDEMIASLLIDTQHEAIQQALSLTSKQRDLDVTQQSETINQQIATAKAETQQTLLNLQIEEAQAQMNLNLARIEAQVAAQTRQLEAKQAEQTALSEINEAELARQRAKHDLAVAVAQEQLNQKLEELRAEVAGVVEKSTAVSPQLIAALQAFSDKALAERMAESMAPLAILGGRSIADVLGQLLQGTVLENVLSAETEE